MPGALRQGDMHLCKKVTGNVPHVGGPGGAPRPAAAATVEINGRPALTIGDTAVCVGEPDKIVNGISTVFLCGKAAADSSAMTDHGGRFTMFSGDVMIG